MGRSVMQSLSSSMEKQGHFNNHKNQNAEGIGLDSDQQQFMGVNCEGWTLYSKEQKYIDAFECGAIEGSYKNLMNTTQDE